MAQLCNRINAAIDKAKGRDEMGLYIHGKYLPPSIRLNMLLVGVLCWREFNLPSWLG